MDIKWINHAGFLLESKEVKLVCDPWIEGTAFDNGWDLLSKTLFKYSDFQDVTHIWFSHEHPDHFSPSNIKKIPLDTRKQITVLYQMTQDKKVIRFCQDAGFKGVIELPPSEWLNINSDFRIMNQSDKDGDSWLAIQAENLCVLNLNDVVSYDTDAELSKLNNLIGKIDVLLTQFSYANWVGNPEDAAFRKHCADEKIKIAKNQIRIFQPKYVIPFASFVWFCNEENYYLNDGTNKIGDVYDALAQENTTTIVMYPNDKWTIGSKFNSENAISKYDIDYQKIENNPVLIKNKEITLPELKTAANNYVGSIIKNNGSIIHWKLRKPAKIYLTDLDQSVYLTTKGLIESKEPKYNCDIAVSTAAIGYCFKFDWGGNTLVINARFEKPVGGNFTNIENYFYISNLNNMGKKYSLMRIFENGFRRLKRKFII